MPCYPRKKIKQNLLAMGLVFFALASFGVHAIVNVRMQTDLGAVDIELFDTQASMNVMNFLNYVNDGDYNGTFFDTSVVNEGLLGGGFGSVLVGGGFTFNPDLGTLVTSEIGSGATLGQGGLRIPFDNIIVESESDPDLRPNVRGTLSMALAAEQPDSARNQWFVNRTDNPTLDIPLDSSDPEDPDHQDGSFTVFGQVVGDGMDIIDAIATQTRCGVLFGLDGLCGVPGDSFRFLRTPMVAVSGQDGGLGIPTVLRDDVSLSFRISQYNLVNLLHIGIDSDGDGIADSLEDEAANEGDFDNDGIPDRNQPDIASYRATSGSLVTLQSEAEIDLESTSFMSRTFGFSTYDVTMPPAILDGFDFTHGHLGFTLDISTVTGVGGKTTVEVTGMKAGCGISSYFQYGPTLDDDTDHWYEFNYDELTDTGAEVNGDVLILHYVDGLRGDSALDLPGIIKTQGGFASFPEGEPDNDGLSVLVEDAAPNDGDGNDDGMCDSVQNNVASFPGPRDEYITLVSPPGTSFNSVGFLDSVILLQGQDISALTSGFNLAYDFLVFAINGLENVGDSVDIRVILPEGNTPVSYFMFGPTPDIAENHLYEFLYDGVTGAEFEGNEIILHFVDGERGDFDVTANGEILDPGAPALKAASVAPNSGGGGGGGCALGDGTRQPVQAGAWYLLLFLCGLYGALRNQRRARQ